MKAGRQFVAWATSTCALTTLTVAPWIPKPSLATAPDFPITELRWWNCFPNDPWQSIQLTVPDQDTTMSAYGGTLRRYDIHVAKMFEVTHYLCQQNIARRTLKGFDWGYEAANGNVYMGGFHISCQLALEVATAYGSKRSEETVLHRPFDDNGDYVRKDDKPAVIRSENYAMPVLNITGTKISKWMDFVQNVHPAFSEMAKKVDRGETIPFPVDTALLKLKDKTRVPILLPSNLPFLPIDVERWGISVKASEDTYRVCVGSLPKLQPCEHSSIRHFDSISAARNGKLEKPKWMSPKDTFREVELAGGIKGFFREGCGAYCTSFLQWKYQGVLYTVSARFGEQPILVKIANSAIAAGPR